MASQQWADLIIVFLTHEMYNINIWIIIILSVILKYINKNFLF